MNFNVIGVIITPKKAIKYLGVWLDSKMVFAEHINKTVEKSLSILMPNIGGPRASKRRLISSVIHSQILYAAPVFSTAMSNINLVKKLNRVRRLMAIKISSAYRTISGEAAGVIAGIPPIELIIKERTEVYRGLDKERVGENVIESWQHKWNNGTYGRWTYTLIPDIKDWINRPYGEVDYYLTQALSGHGNFRKYLYERRRVDNDECPYCKEVDDVEHTLFRCLRWEEIRSTFENRTGQNFNATNMMRCLLQSEQEWNEANTVVQCIMQTKERESR